MIASPAEQVREHQHQQVSQDWRLGFLFLQQTHQILIHHRQQQLFLPSQPWLEVFKTLPDKGDLKRKLNKQKKNRLFNLNAMVRSLTCSDPSRARSLRNCCSLLRCSFSRFCIRQHHLSHTFHSLYIHLCAVMSTITDEDWGCTHDEDNIAKTQSYNEMSRHKFDVFMHER